MKDRRCRRAFFTAFVCTLCVLALAAGVLAVDYFSRKIGFGDDNTLITKITGKSLSVGCAPPDLLL